MWKALIGKLSLWRKRIRKELGPHSACLYLLDKVGEGDTRWLHTSIAESKKIPVLFDNVLEYNIFFKDWVSKVSNGQYAKAADMSLIKEDVSLNRWFVANGRYLDVDRNFREFVKTCREFISLHEVYKLDTGVKNDGTMRLSIDHSQPLVSNLTELVGVLYEYKRSKEQPRGLARYLRW